MDLRKNTLWIAALIGMIAIGSAITVFVTNEDDAIAELEKPVEITKEKCTIDSIEKTAGTKAEVSSNPTIVKFRLEYFNPDYATSKGEIGVADNSDAVIKAAVENACEQKWEEVKARKENTEKTVIIQYPNDLLNQYYDLDDKKWKQATNSLGLGG